MRRPKIYLAGPDIFLPNAVEIARVKNQLTTEAGFLPLNPMDNNLGKPPKLRAEREQFADLIFQADFERERELYACRTCHTPLQEQQPERITGLASLKPVAPSPPDMTSSGTRPCRYSPTPVAIRSASSGDGCPSA